jgi:hypothetical protein
MGGRRLSVVEEKKNRTTGRNPSSLFIRSCFGREGSEEPNTAKQASVNPSDPPRRPSIWLTNAGMANGERWS